MIVNIYTIKDELANSWGNLILLNPKVVERSFRYMAQEMEKGDCEDRRIYLMGTYDTETGQIVPSQPTMVFNLEEAKKMAVRIFKPYEDEKPASVANSPGNRLEPEYKERYDERGVAYLEQVGEVDTYAKIQSYRDECDVMSILSRYAAGDTSVLSNPGWYIDTTKMPATYTDYLNLMNEQREKFEQLPLEIRMKFNNNFNEYMATAGEESWMRNMGLYQEKKPVETEVNKDEQKQ